jgi:hypothetical protein
MVDMAGDDPTRVDGRAASPAPAAPMPPTVGWLSLPPLRYPNQYVWFVFFSALDIMLTWAILERGGREVNPLAHVIIDAWGLNGAIAFKFSLTILVIIVCEITARERLGLARMLSITAIIISAMPVLYSLALLVVHTLDTCDRPIRRRQREPTHQQRKLDGDRCNPPSSL